MIGLVIRMRGIPARENSQCSLSMSIASNFLPFFFFSSLREIGDALCRRKRAASNDVGASYAAENKMQLTTMAASVH